MRTPSARVGLDLYIIHKLRIQRIYALNYYKQCFMGHGPMCEKWPSYKNAYANGIAVR